MSILQQIENYINEFNQDYNEAYSYDTLRIKFKKRYKLERLKDLGEWNKLHKNDKKIRSRLTAKEATSAYKLQNQNIYYYNNPTPPKYDDAVMVIYGLKQYHKDAPQRELILKILAILKDVTEIDICLDVNYTPNFKLLEQCYNLDRYKNTTTYYINKPDITMIKKICIYNKSYKNGLNGTLWRYEATITIPNINDLAIPLHDLKELADIGMMQNIKSKSQRIEDENRKVVENSLKLKAKLKRQKTLLRIRGLKGLYKKNFF